MTRSYSGPQSVGAAYDGWTADGVLEHFWGEHIHHGFYPEGRWSGVDFKAAKSDMVDRLLQWAGVRGAERVLDVGCGIGGSSRHLSRRLDAEVTGVTLSSAQVARARQLTPSRVRARFQVADALELPFDDGSFDLVWSCESGEHMPDKRRFLSEMTRVLAPGGVLVMATWVRSAGPTSARAERRLRRIYQDWALPPFARLEDYEAWASADSRLDRVRTGDWSRSAAPTWAHQLVLGARSLPWLLRQGSGVLRRTLVDTRSTLGMIRGYGDGSIRYGIFRAERTPAEVTS